MERIIINKREAEAAHFIGRLENACKDLNGFIEKLNSINSFRVADNHKDLLFQSSGDGLANAIESACRAELAAAKVQSQSVINSAVKGDLEAFYTLRNAFHFYDGSLISYITLEKGTAVISDEIIMRIEEEHTNAISTEMGKNLYETVKAIAELVSRAAGMIDPAYRGVSPKQAVFNLVSGEGAECEASVNVAYDRLTATKSATN